MRNGARPRSPLIHTAVQPIVNNSEIMESILHNLHNNGDNNCWKRAWLIARRADSLDFQRFALYSLFATPRYDRLLSQTPRIQQPSFHELVYGGVQNVPVIWFIGSRTAKQFIKLGPLEYFLYGVYRLTQYDYLSQLPPLENTRPWTPRNLSALTRTLILKVFSKENAWLKTCFISFWNVSDWYY